MVSRRSSAFNCGHVAWGYSRTEAGRTYYSFGSVEDPTGLPFAPPSLMVFWSLTAPGLSPAPVLEQLERFRYVSFKLWEVPAADPGAADRAAERQGGRSYLVFTNNCLNSVHQVLTAYGAGDPHIHDPAHPRSWIPNFWFDRIPFQPRPLRELEVALKELGT